MKNSVYKFQDSGQNGGCARQGNSIRRVNKGKIGGTSDSLDGDREIKRRLIDRHDDKAVMNCFCETTVSASLWLYLKRLYFISSSIAYCILPYASFYAGLSCLCLSKTPRYNVSYSNTL